MVRQRYTLPMTDLRALIASKEPQVGRERFIAVDGHAGSGKSTFASMLAEKLGAQVIRQDDFASWDNPFDWWPLIIERVFDPIKNGATTLNYPRTQWWDNNVPGPVVDQPVTDIMILEGVSSSRTEFRDYISLAIFVDTPKELCLQRGIERDKSTGKPVEEITKLWEGWIESEEKYMNRDNPKAHADLVIDGTTPIEEQVTF